MNNESDDQEISDEEQAAFIDWWNTYIPKEYIAILKAKEYAVAVKAIEKIVTTLQSCCDEDEMPKLQVRFDKMFGTNIALILIIPECGIQFTNDKLLSAIGIVPANCTISILPMKDFQTRISFTFHNVKELIAHEEKPDIPPIG